MRAYKLKTTPTKNGRAYQLNSTTTESGRAYQLTKPKQTRWGEIFTKPAWEGTEMTPAMEKLKAAGFSPGARPTPYKSKPITFGEKLWHLPSALMDVFGFTEAIETIKAPPEAWTSLSFKERAKLYYPEVGKQLLQIAESYPKSAVQFIATPVLGVIENITGQPIDDVTLPTRVGEWIGPLSGTNAQILSFEKQGYTTNQAKTLVVAQQAAKSLPFVMTFSSPVYIQQLFTKPSTEQVLHYQYNKAVSTKANQVVKSAKLPQPTAGSVKTSGGSFEQIVRIKGMPDRYLTIHTEPISGIKSVQGWDLTDPAIQIPTSAILKGAPEIPMSQVPSGINFVKANPLFSGVNTALKTISIEKSHTLFLEEAVKRVAPIIAKKLPVVPPIPVPTPVKSVVKAIPKKIEITPIKQVINKFEQTGTADILIGKDYGISIKDEGENFIKVIFGPNKLTKVGEGIEGSRSFSTKKEAFEFVKEIQDRIKKIVESVKEVKPELKSTQNTEYNQVVNKTKEQPVDVITKEDLDVLARGELKTITPEGAKPINPEKEAMDKIIDLYTGFPISKLY